MTRLHYSFFVLSAALLVLPASVYAEDNTNNHLLRWGERSISSDDLSRYLLELPDEAVSNYLMDSENVQNGPLNIYKRQVITDAAIAAGIDKSPVYQQIMRNESEKALVNLYRQKYLQELSIDRLESLAYEEYLAYPERYTEPERRSVSHILITSAPEQEQAETDNGDMEEAPVLLLDLQRRIQNDEISFADAARQYSEDSGSKSSGGDLGMIERGKTVPAFDAAVFSANKVGLIDDLIKSRYGWHLISIDKIEAEHKRSFEEVKAQIMAAVEKRDKDERWIQHIDELGMQDGAPEIDKQNLDKFIQSYLKQRGED